MIAYLNGSLLERSANEVIILVNGVGYLVYCSTNTLSNLPKSGENCELYIKMIVREDAMELYGFAKHEEKTLFNMLTTISGVGPKTALGILGTMNTKDLKTAIAMNDTVALSRAPGIGKKTAQRIALELRDKMSDELLLASEESSSFVDAMPPADRDAKSDALVALKSLGYTQMEAAKAIQIVMQQHAGEALHSDDIIRYALKTMSEF